MKRLQLILLAVIVNINLLFGQDSTQVHSWTLEQCIDYALSQNIQVRQTMLTNLSNKYNIEQAKGQQLPSLNASVSYNVSWQNTEDATTGESEFSNSQNNNYGVNSNVTLYNYGRLNNLIKQAKLDMEAGVYNSEAVKETVTLNILDAYLQVIFYTENVDNSQQQLNATEEQANFAQERLTSGLISRSDYLQVKSQMATEKLNLINAQSQLAIAKVNLMQMMLLPVTPDFEITYPKLNEEVNQQLSPNPAEVYAISAQIRPALKNAELQKESAALNEKISKASYFPTLSANAGLSTGYYNTLDQTYANQLNDRFTPNVGLTLSIPIFQNKQVKTNVAKARINYQSAELQEQDTQNNLRMNIEQICVDVRISQLEYEASLEQYQANEESYSLAEEKYKNGLMNSVDFIFEKNNMTQAESSFLQSKYKLLFNYKILDFYMGQAITL
ncbi:TolC family protein [Carboxylicivirga sp. A043]|uniref:TolC family protein n=1 Tax=Carboxylicivirga litoralis TaxID=2816963 RepID=UPI0021CB1BBA|nr:TolC family protein [Carboxylicivirga sp. A043]MCU4155837.1 TolC family protein [Carboxylicivirga sp. A043]